MPSRSTDKNYSDKSKLENEKQSRLNSIILFIFLFSLLLANHFICFIATLFFFQQTFIIVTNYLLISILVTFGLMLAIEIQFIIYLIFYYYKQTKQENINSIKVFYFFVFAFIIFLSVINHFNIQYQLNQQQNFYRKQFVKEIQLNDNDNNNNNEVTHGSNKNEEDNWLNNVQRQYQCCGYNNKLDYRKIYKPTSCCNVSIEDNDKYQRCIQKRDVDGNVGAEPEYYSQGCADIVNRVIENYSSILFYAGAVDFSLIAFFIIMINVFVLSINQYIDSVNMECHTEETENQYLIVKIKAKFNFLSKMIQFNEEYLTDKRNKKESEVQVNLLSSTNKMDGFFL